MQSKVIICLMAVFTILSISSYGYERVDAGCEGIKVNLYGSDKGVDDISLITGAVWYNPFTEQVYEYPTYVQTVDYPAFTINAKYQTEIWLKYYFNSKEGPYYDALYTYWRFKDKFFSRKI